MENESLSADLGNDESFPNDKRTTQLLQIMASYIHTSIRLNIDYPAKHGNGIVSMLDIKEEGNAVLWIQPHVYRCNVINSAPNLMKTIKEKNQLGIRPISRTKEGKRLVREIKKDKKKNKWDKNGGLYSDQHPKEHW